MAPRSFRYLPPALLLIAAAPSPARAAAPAPSAVRVPAPARDASIERLERRIAQLEALVTARSVADQRLPEAVRLLGQEVPLHLKDVRERMEREFVVALSDRASLVLWQKRAGKVFPVIEQAIRDKKLLQDLKYVAVIESGLRSHAKSWAGAVGPWQFMPATGRENGLKVAKTIDERRDLRRATDAALDFLSSLHRRFGDWFLALAAYNCGPGRVSRALKAQNVTSYWDLSLPNEAERYVARVAAVAVILRNADRYGMRVPDADRFDPNDTRRVRIAVGKAVPVVRIARAAKTTYRHIRKLNPWLRSATLPAGKHRLTVPADTDSGFVARVAGLAPSRGRASAPKTKSKARRATAAAAKKPKAKKSSSARHKVRRGESLSDIAQRHGVGLTALQRHNSIRRPDKIYVGQVLRIPGKGKAKPARKVRHKIRRGESLWDVAEKYGVTVAELKRKNSIRRPDRIFPGQVLRIR